MIDTLHRPIGRLSLTCLSCDLENPIFKAVFTGEEAILTFKPWHVFEGFISDKDSGGQRCKPRDEWTTNPSGALSNPFIQ